MSCSIGHDLYTMKIFVKQRHNIYHLSQLEGLPAPLASEGHLKHHTIQLIKASSLGLSPKG